MLMVFGYLIYLAHNHTFFARTFLPYLIGAPVLVVLPRFIAANLSNHFILLVGIPALIVVQSVFIVRLFKYLYPLLINGTSREPVLLSIRGVPASFQKPVVEILRRQPLMTDDKIRELQPDLTTLFSFFPAVMQHATYGHNLSGYLKTFIDPNKPEEKFTPRERQLNSALEGLSYVSDSILRLYYTIELPTNLRAQHQHIIAPSGSGKTTLLRDMIMKDVDAGNSVVLIDSQMDLINQLRQVLPLDKLIVIDPTDIEHPLALNFMDIGQNQSTRTPLEREQSQNSAVALFTYIFAALLDSPMTSKQQTLFEFSTRLLMTVPGATLSSLRQLFEDGGLEKYRTHINKLSDTQRDFFLKRFHDKGYNDTKEQILRRIYGMSSVPTLDRMFSQPVSKFDMFTALEEGKVVLVNTAKSLLQDDGAALFGRLFISMVRQACFNRANQKNRKRTYLYLDEAHEYLDDSTTTLLEQARKYEIGLIVAHQNTSQLSPAMRNALTAGTAIKFAGKILDITEARAVTATMRTTVERMEALPQFYFLAYLAGIGTFDYRAKEDSYTYSPKHSPEALTAHRDHMRALYSQQSNSPDIPDSSPTPEPEAGAWT
jgi:hypothetical protein